MDGTMSRELICSWLGLPPGEWPPNHYTLLGLSPGECDLHLIEMRVHQRLDAVRRYQMCHPEPATEAMNRLAQAFVCLTEPAAKRRYDVDVLGLPLPAVATATAEPEISAATTNGVEWTNGHASASVDTVTGEHSAPGSPTPAPASDTKVIVVGSNDTVPSPPPIRRPPPTDPEFAVADLLPLLVDSTPPSSPTPPPPSAPKIDPAAELARSHQARRGLGSRRAFLQRARQTRRLLELWRQLGQYLASSRRRLPRAAEAEPLVNLLEELDAELVTFPPVLGEAGQPGYHVVNLARQEDLDHPAFHLLDREERKSISRDWQSGLNLLEAHRSFLLGELRCLRRRGMCYWVVRTVRAFVNERPTVVLLGLAALALLIAVLRRLGYLY
jgi:hypothetical protein